jgi:hypothetical protein
MTCFCSEVSDSIDREAVTSCDRATAENATFRLLLTVALVLAPAPTTPVGVD